jgi:hypothetical protein
MRFSLCTDTPPEQVAHHYAAKGTLLDFVIPRELDRNALEAIARTHASQPHGDCVLDLVVAHPACDEALVDVVLELGADSSEVLNTVATSGKASLAQLESLRDSEHACVREHVEMALLEYELAVGDFAVFAEVLRRYRDNESLGYGVRYRLATHPRTPPEVLREIAAHQDPPGDLARQRLANGNGD